MKIVAKIKQNSILSKSLYTLMIVALYLIGTHIFLVVDKTQLSHVLTLVSAVSGGDLTQLNLFSLGLSPWMSAMLIWRALAMSKKLNLAKKPKKATDRWQLYITLALASLQAISVVLTLGTQNTLTHWQTFIVILTLIAGSFVLVWLANLNVVHGIGGPTAIIIVGLSKNIFYQSVRLVNDTLFSILIVIVLLTVVLTIMMDRAELRIPLNRFMLNTSFYDSAYLPIKLNPAGALPMMYVIIILSIPQYIFALFTMVQPNNAQWQTLMQQLQLQQPLGIGLYMVLLYALAIGFAFMNVDPEETAKQLRLSGDYIDNVNPGKDTKRYIQYKLLRVASVGAILTCLVSGWPFIYQLVMPMSFELMMFPTTVMILVGMLLTIIDQIDVLCIKRQYQSLF